MRTQESIFYFISCKICTSYQQKQPAKSRGCFCLIYFFAKANFWLVLAYIVGGT